jgi:AraC family transcriptional regulator, transcriptional activator for feuABC-ybbA operon
VPQKLSIEKIIEIFSQEHIKIIRVQRNVVAPGSKFMGAKTPPHPGFVIPLSGQARMHFNKIPYDMSQGKIFHFAPTMTLDKEVIGEEYWDYMVIQYENPAKNPHAYSDYETDISFTPQLYDLLLQLYIHCAIPGQFPAEQAQHLFLNILEKSKPGETTSAKQDESVFIEATKFIDEHYMMPLNIPDLAQKYGFTAKQFTQLFRKCLGISPNQYIIDYRIQRARELLSCKEYSVAEVSSCVGYTDPYYFSRIFKKKMGMSPSQLQK